MTPGEFGETVLRANMDGSLVRLRDGAEVERAGQSYGMQTRFDERPSSRSRSRKVLVTLAEAMALVVAVMFLFLQNVRDTLIPTVVVPVARLGTCGALLLAGFFINVPTMFGMVPAIGILVDDAIVVVENVARIMNEAGLAPRAATAKAMGQITGAIVGIALAPIAVFVPRAFFPGSVGVIHRQFAVSMTTSIAFSAFLALSPHRRRR